MVLSNWFGLLCGLHAAFTLGSIEWAGINYTMKGGKCVQYVRPVRLLWMIPAEAAAVARLCANSQQQQQQQQQHDLFACIILMSAYVHAFFRWLDLVPACPLLCENYSFPRVTHSVSKSDDAKDH